MCIAQGPQRTDASEARPRGPSVSSQALYHWATTLSALLFSGAEPFVQFYKGVYEEQFCEII